MDFKVSKNALSFEAWLETNVRWFYVWSSSNTRKLDIGFLGSIWIITLHTWASRGNFQKILEFHKSIFRGGFFFSRRWKEKRWDVWILPALPPWGLYFPDGFFQVVATVLQYYYVRTWYKYLLTILCSTILQSRQLNWVTWVYSFFFSIIDRIVPSKSFVRYIQNSQFSGKS